MRKHVNSMVDWRLFMLALSSVASSATRYSDYSDVHMPHYRDHNEDREVAPAPEEYHDRSPDAPARLDYKYEEEPQGKSDDLVKAVEDERIWDKPLKKKRIPSVSDIDSNIDLDKYSTDEPHTKLRSNGRLFKHKSRIQKDDPEEIVDRRIYSRARSIGLSDEIDETQNKRDYADKEEEYRADNFDTFDEKSKLINRSPTKRKARRKPRDRTFTRSERRNDDSPVSSDEDNIDSDRRMGRKYMGDRGMRTFNEPPRPTVRSNNLIDVNRNKKNYDDYEEYYDMKRVHSMKNRLPALFRQTKVTSERTESTPLLDWSFRRADSPGQQSEKQPDTTAAALIITSTQLPSASTVQTVISTSLRFQPSEVTLINRNTSELSLAEKSRLSILKKAQRKESSRNMSSTTKPPVLMQVTRRMQTLVMVEPQQAEEPVPRAREVAEDSAERVARAKRLMRHKLVSRARNLQDLTDNWDEMICDYIDVDLLDSRSTPLELDKPLIICLSLLCFFMLL